MSRWPELPRELAHNLEAERQHHLDQLKEGARHPAELPAAGSLLPDVPPLVPDPPAPNLDLFRATQERMPL